MPKEIHQPQDSLFKSSMGNPKVLKEFLSVHLPKNLLKRMDLNTAKLEKETYLDEAHRKTASDIVVSVKVDNKDAFIYLVCEHQSKVDKHMAYRMMRYTIRLLEQFRLAHPNLPLPVVVPLVLYAGKRPWNAALDVCELFGEQADLAREFLFKPYILIDLYRMSDDDIMKHKWSGVMAYALKHRRAVEVETYLKRIFCRLVELEENDPIRGIILANTVINYIADGLETGQVETYDKCVDEYLIGDIRREAMTLREAFEQRGEQRGVQRGIQKGVHQGVKLGEKKTFARLLREGVLTSEEVENLSGFSSEELKTVDFQEDKVA